MNPRQQRFAEEYAVDHNGAQAAFRAGYAETRAKQTAHRLLARPDVASRVEQLDAEKREELGIDRDQWFEWVLEVREEAMRGKPRTYRDRLVRDENGDVIYDPNLTAAVKILEAIGRQLGLMSDRQTVEHTGEVIYTLQLDRTLPGAAGEDAA